VSQLARNGYTYAPFITKSNAQKIGKDRPCISRDAHGQTNTHTDRQTVHIPQILQQKLSLLISGKLVSTRSKLKNTSIIASQAGVKCLPQGSGDYKHRRTTSENIIASGPNYWTGKASEVWQTDRIKYSLMENARVVLSVLPFFSAVTAG